VTLVAHHGRPPKSASERLSEVLRVRMTTAEADTLYRRAIRDRCSLSAYLRRCLFRGPENTDGIAMR
jgi:hypothetical protein